MKEQAFFLAPGSFRDPANRVYLISSPGKVFTRDTILSAVWGDDVVVGDRTIDVHIRKLREKIGDHYFKTVKGVGYKFVLDGADK